MRLHRDHKTKLLKGVPLFHGCSDDELTKVAKLAAEVEFGDGDTLLRAGTSGHEFLVLVEGQAEVLMGGEHLAEAGPGAYFGEISLLEQTRRTATVVAKGEVHVLAWDDEGFKRMLAEVPTVRAKVNKQAFERLANVEPDQPAD